MIRDSREWVCRRATGRTLELGAGTGLNFRWYSADVELVAVDLDHENLEISADRARELGRADRLAVADGHRLPFGPDAFETVVCTLAICDVDDREAVMAETYRVVRPGGAVVVVTWGEPQAMPAASVITALRPLLPPPPPNARGPFALSDKAALTGFAEAAGLQPESVFDVDSPFTYPDLPTALRGLNSSGVAAAAMERAGEEAVSAAHATALAPFKQADGSYHVPAHFRCLIARRA